MRFPHAARSIALTLFGVVPAVAGAAHAAVPTGYTGTPYKGTPQAIPGRVELADMDLGGKGVAWDTDWNRMNSAQYEPISGNDYRPDDKNLPNICKTNKASKDYYLGSMAIYPPSSPTKEFYYMGYAHAGDWVRMTVDVKVAGKYNVSSTWASDTANWGLSIWFNDGSNAGAPMDGVNKTGVVYMPGTSNYHLWKDYPNFTQVDLSAGLQIMTFKVEREPHLQYGFLQFDLVGGNPATGTAGTGGGAGTGGSSTGGAGTGATNTGTAGTTGAAGTGTATGEAGTGGTSAGAAGTGAATAGTGGSSTGAAGTGSATGAAGTSGIKPGRDDSGGGCAISGSRRPEATIAGVLLFALVALRRRRAS